MELSEIKANYVYLDANIFMYSLEGHEIYLPKIIALFNHLKAKNILTVTSELTLAECLVKPMMDENKAMQSLYLSQIKSNKRLQVKSISKDVLIKSSSIRAATKMKTPDAIHIATALIFDCSLFITNDKRIRAYDEMQVLILEELEE